MTFSLPCPNLPYPAQTWLNTVCPAKPDITVCSFIDSRWILFNSNCYSSFLDGCWWVNLKLVCGTIHLLHPYISISPFPMSVLFLRRPEILEKSPTCFDIYSVTSKQEDIFLQIFKECLIRHHDFSLLTLKKGGRHKWMSPLVGHIAHTHKLMFSWALS